MYGARARAPRCGGYMGRYVVTGAAGFIGSHVTDALLARGDAVIGIDSFNAFYDPRIKEDNLSQAQKSPQFTLVRGNILDDQVWESVFTQNIDGIIHLAAWPGVRQSILEPYLYQRENVDGTLHILEHLRKVQERTQRRIPLVFASSSSVYGTSTRIPFAEDDTADHPVSPYAMTKRCGELLAHTYFHLFRIDVTCLRFFTVYGPRQRPDLAIHKFAQRIYDKNPIPVFGDGSAQRDYTYIDDIVSGVLGSLSELEAKGGYHVYNLGNAHAVRLDTLIEKLSERLGIAPILDHQPMPAGDVLYTCADLTRVNTAIGYQPTTNLDDGLDKFIAWFLQKQKKLQQ